MHVFVLWEEDREHAQAQGAKQKLGGHTAGLPRPCSYRRMGGMGTGYSCVTRRNHVTSPYTCGCVHLWSLIVNAYDAFALPVVCVTIALRLSCSLSSGRVGFSDPRVSLIH